MTICTADGEKSVSFGSTSICFSLYSTIVGRIPDSKSKYPLAVSLLESHSCKAKDAATTADQFRSLQNQLSQIDPKDAIYSIQTPEKKAPWSERMPSSVSSCANLYTTEDGLDLLEELINLLLYASSKKTDVIPCY